MKSKISREAIDDIKEQYGLDISAKLEQELVDELSKSIDKEIISNIFNIGKRDALIEETKVKIRKERRLGKIDDIIS